MADLNEQILVTGVTGYIGVECLAQLIKAFFFFWFFSKKKPEIARKITFFIHFTGGIWIASELYTGLSPTKSN